MELRPSDLALILDGARARAIERIEVANEEMAERARALAPLVPVTVVDFVTPNEWRLVMMVKLDNVKVTVGFAEPSGG